MPAPSTPAMVPTTARSHGQDDQLPIDNDEEGKWMLATTSIKACRICGDTIGRNVDGETFVACRECGFPVCRPCYEYERKEGNQACPNCHIRYRRHKGSARVFGGEDDDADQHEDIGDEFPITDRREADAHQLENGDHAAETSIPGRNDDFEGEGEMNRHAEWKERVEKWKSRQEKKGFALQKDSAKNDDDEEEADDRL